MRDPLAALILIATLGACSSDITPVDYCMRAAQIECEAYACCSMTELRRPCEYDPSSDAFRHSCEQSNGGFDGVNVRWDARAAVSALASLERAAAACTTVDPDTFTAPLVPLLHVGDPCLAVPDVRSLGCIDGWCDIATERCVVPGNLGDACGGCAQGLYCEPSTHHCAASLADGSPCSSAPGAAPCLSGLCGVSGVCADRLADSAHCDLFIAPSCVGECIGSVCRTEGDADYLYCRGS